MNAQSAKQRECGIALKTGSPMGGSGQGRCAAGLQTTSNQSDQFQAMALRQEASKQCPGNRGAKRAASRCATAPS
eukprot:3691227-Alexandrium_andersonii.AAC.1